MILEEAPAAQNGGYVRVQQDASRFSVGTAMVESDCMNIRAACAGNARYAAAGSCAGGGAGGADGVLC